MVCELHPNKTLRRRQREREKLLVKAEMQINVGLIFNLISIHDYWKNQ